MEGKNCAKAVLNPFTERSDETRLNLQCGFCDKTGNSLQVHCKTRRNAAICAGAKLEVDEGIGLL